jgi:calcineurin-like phosphoesterase family protein
MNNQLIKNWNSVVQPNDTIYVVGDFSFSGIEKQRNILSQLQGIKHLVRGNHDFEKMHKYIDMGFTAVHDFTIIEDLFVCHYPLYNEQQLQENAINRTHDGSKYLIEKFFRHYHESFKYAQQMHNVKYIAHGHIHCNHFVDSDIKHINVGVDVHNYTPISLEQIKNKLIFC